MKLFATAIALAVLAVIHASAAVLYAPTPIGSSARISDYGSSDQTGFRSFDNFTVGSYGAKVERVSWSGFWLDLSNPVPAPAPDPDVLSWEIAFYADDAGVPGTQLFFESLNASDAASTFLGTSVFGASGFYNVSAYRYSVDLTTPFAASPATTYWISVLSRSSSYYPAWTLYGATGGDDETYQQQLGPALSILNTNTVPRDRAFVLEGTVPEPSTMLVCAAGLALLTTFRRV